MTPKSALFISVAMTAFVLVMLAGVVLSLNSATNSKLALAETPTQAIIDTPFPVQVEPAPTQLVRIGPEQAASIAAQFTNKTDVYSVETLVTNGVTSFKVTFSSGNIVFVALDGQILSTSALQPSPAPVNPLPGQTTSSNRSSPGGGEPDDGGDG
jgi:hypothetical protein